MSWDDGAHNKVKKVQITYDEIINSIEVTYDRANLQSQRRGSVGPKSSEFTLETDEYITALSAYSKTVGTQDVVTALTFTTNKTTYGPYGTKTGYQISAPEATGKQIAGFFGTSSNVLNEIDVHYGPLPIAGGGGSESGSGVQKLDARGGTGGTKWDDGSDYEGVTKITVRSSNSGVQLIKFDYVKGGQAKEGATHGVMAGRGSPIKEIVINHPTEYLVSVEGWYDSSNIIQGIKFITNQKTSDLVGFELESGGTSFTLQVKDKKIIGFHGFAGDHINSIGAYFVPSSSTTPPSTSAKKLKAEGGDAGDVWDDGAHDDVKKVTIGQSNDGISFVKFEYLKGSQVTYKDGHGKRTMLPLEEFELGAGEYIMSVEGTYDKIAGFEQGIMTMLKFKTNLRTSIPFGMKGSLPFTLKEEGYKIVGFHGQAKEVLHSIGAYVAPLGLTPLGPSTPSTKLEGDGGDSGASWDDGAFDGVKRVYVGQAHEGVAAVKFVYAKGDQEVETEHGTRGQLGYEGFELDYPSEYIIQIGGTYDTIYGVPGPVITLLRFKTNKRVSIPFGLEAGTRFTVTREGHKIVGFHGKASDLLYNFGVHVAPITN